MECPLTELKAAHPTKEWRVPRILYQVWESNRLWPRYTVPKDPLRCNDSIHEVTTQYYQDLIMRIKDAMAIIILDYVAHTAMALPSETVVR